MAQSFQPSKEASTSRAQRSALRRSRLVTNRAQNFEEAERWDLDFWQARTPQERLSELVHLHRDVELAQAARRAQSDRQR